MEQHEIVLFEFKEGNSYLEITINERTLERVIIRGNYNPLSEDQFQAVIDDIINLSPDKMLVFTGDNDLGYQFAKSLDNIGRVVLLVPPGVDTSDLTGKSNIRIVESLTPEVDYIQQLSYVTLRQGNTGGSLEADDLPEKVQPATIFKDESTYF